MKNRSMSWFFEKVLVTLTKRKRGLSLIKLEKKEVRILQIPVKSIISREYFETHKAKN